MRKHEASLSKQPEGSREKKKALADFCFTLHAGNGHDSGRALPDPSDPQLWGGSSKGTVAQLLLGSPCTAQPPAHLQPSNPIPGGLWLSASPHAGFSLRSPGADHTLIGAEMCLSAQKPQHCSTQECLRDDLCLAKKFSE